MTVKGKRKGGSRKSSKRSEQQKRYHVLGSIDGESERRSGIALEECREDGSEGPTYVAYPTSSGIPLLPGSKLGKFVEVDDEHVAFTEDLDGAAAGDDSEHDQHGPAQVATDAYRAGWSRTFGKN